MLKFIKKIPNLFTHPRNYIFSGLNLEHKPDTLWLEFGVWNGDSINFIASHTQDKVYGFDSFEGLPERWREGYDVGMFSRNGEIPEVAANVEIVKGWFKDTLPGFINSQNKKVSLIHIDVDLYSSTKCVLETLKEHMDVDCIIIFDELVNYPGFDGETGELKAFYEFVMENNVDFEWIGMNGSPTGMCGYDYENVAVKIRSVNSPDFVRPEDPDEELEVPVDNNSMMDPMNTLELTDPSLAIEPVDVSGQEPITIELVESEPAAEPVSEEPAAEPVAN